MSMQIACYMLKMATSARPQLHAKHNIAEDFWVIFHSTPHAFCSGYSKYFMLHITYTLTDSPVITGKATNPSRAPH